MNRRLILTLSLLVTALWGLAAITWTADFSTPEREVISATGQEVPAPEKVEENPASEPNPEREERVPVVPIPAETREAEPEEEAPSPEPTSTWAPCSGPVPGLGVAFQRKCTTPDGKLFDEEAFRNSLDTCEKAKRYAELDHEQRVNADGDGQTRRSFPAEMFPAVTDRDHDGKVCETDWR